MCRVLNNLDSLARFVPAWALLMGLASPAGAAEESARHQVQAAERAYTEGDYPTALEKYAAAQEAMKDSAELAYNRGLAHYKLGQFAEARDRFEEALATHDPELEAKTKFNLGNCDYGEALTQTQKPDEAGKLLNRAITHYRDTLEIAPRDADARTNIELAQRLIQQLQEQRQQQQPNQPQQQDQEQQNQEQQQQQSQNQDQNDNQSESQQQQQPSEGNDNQEQPRPEPQESEPPQEQPEEPQGQEQQQAEPEGKPSDQEQDDMTPQEAERMLQAVRDKERKRSEEKAKRMRAQRARVARDW